MVHPSSSVVGLNSVFVSKLHEAVFHTIKKLKASNVSSIQVVAYPLNFSKPDSLLPTDLFAFGKMVGEKLKFLKHLEIV